MDLAIYLSDLLSRDGKINVPGMGSFTRSRQNGYYNNQENKFYPPHYGISFDPESSNDEGALVNYITATKNISAASAQYFVEKFVSTTLEKAAVEEVAIADLGWLYTDNSKLAFKPAAINEAGADFFGYAPIDVKEIGQQQSRNSLTDDRSAKQVHHTSHTEANYANQHIQTEYYDDEPSPKRSVNIWLVLLIIITVVALALLGVYQYNPSLFDHQATAQLTTVKPVIKPVNKTDTIKKDTIKTNNLPQKTTTADTVSKTVMPQAAPADSLKGRHFEILGGAFKSLNEANATIKTYERMGFNARILNNVHGRLHKITLGSFATRMEAEAAEQALLKTGKIRKANIYIQDYNPKQ